MRVELEPSMYIEECYDRFTVTFGHMLHQCQWCGESLRYIAALLLSVSLVPNVFEYEDPL